MFKRMTSTVLMIILSIGMLAACTVTIVPATPNVPTIAPTTAAASTSAVAPTATLPSTVPPTTVPSVTAAPVEPTAVPAVTPVVVSASPRDPGISGTARWGTTPIENAIVELRTGDWRVNSNAVLQRATADPEGRYFIANPPAGDYVMCGLFPEGVQERSTCTPVHIETGQDVAGIDVMLLRTVNAVAPSMGAQVVALPTLSWQSFPNAAQYEVFVIDAGTTELLVHEFVADTHFTVTTPLQPGRTYDWVINAVAADGGLLADGESRFVVQP